MLSSTLVTGFIFSYFAIYYESEVGEPTYEIGETSAGDSCRIVAKWGKSTKNIKEYNKKIDGFIKRENGTEDKWMNWVQYDCFLDHDTQLYQLNEVIKIEDTDGFKQKFVFHRKSGFGICIEYQYRTVCSYSDNRVDMLCLAQGECTRIAKYSAFFAAFIFSLFIIILCYFCC